MARHCRGRAVSYVVRVGHCTDVRGNAPSLSESERLRRLRPLDLARIAVTPKEAVDAVGASPRQVVISMVGERPAYRFSHLGRWTTVYADTGQRLLGLNRDQAVEITRGL